MFGTSLCLTPSQAAQPTRADVMVEGWRPRIVCAPAVRNHCTWSVVGGRVSLGSHSQSARAPETGSLDGEPRSGLRAQAAHPDLALDLLSLYIRLWPWTFCISRAALAPPSFCQPALGSEFPEQSRSSQPQEHDCSLMYFLSWIHTGPSSKNAEVRVRTHTCI